MNTTDDGHISVNEERVRKRFKAIEAERASADLPASVSLLQNARHAGRYFTEAELPFVVDDVKHVQRMFKEGRELYRALSVLVLDTRIRAFLEVNDPKALEQARRALGDLPTEKD